MEDWSSCLTKAVLFSEATSTACKKGRGRLAALAHTGVSDAILEAQIKASCLCSVQALGDIPQPHAGISDVLRPLCSGTWAEPQSSTDQNGSGCLDSDVDGIVWSWTWPLWCVICVNCSISKGYPSNRVSYCKTESRISNVLKFLWRGEVNI